MLIARVIGPVVMTIKHPVLQGEKVLAVQPLDEVGGAHGAPLLALDRAQAGAGDRVLVMREGSGCRQILGRDTGMPVGEAVQQPVPVRSMIVGIIDEVETSGAAS